ncbi:MAG: hypothetical protein ONB44_06905 [candidate division KSB1 bacterium]|nr:hypothetical protein [candidate division KSB1 bacterium]MDZ7301853.1 hypothetical protein [candidate division KSB1 bacterium]MDZ7310236.1 hypothetical protein [candidate division KSB1 bacterium]
MIPFKILTKRLPVKWQKDLRETLGDAAAPPTPADAEAKTGDSAQADTADEIVVTTPGPHIVEDLVRWIQRMNRQQKSTRPAAQSFQNQGISLTIERADGTKITLTERNAGVVKQFLSS